MMHYNLLHWHWYFFLVLHNYKKRQVTCVFIVYRGNQNVRDMKSKAIQFKIAAELEFEPGFA